jgi:hypothetical protein
MAGYEISQLYSIYLSGKCRPNIQRNVWSNQVTTAAFPKAFDGGILLDLKINHISPYYYSRIYGVYRLFYSHDQQLHNYFTNYHNLMCFDTTLSSAVSLQSISCQGT